MDGAEARVPFQADAYVILYDGGKRGRVDCGAGDDIVLPLRLYRQLQTGHFKDPILIVAVAKDGRSRDVTAEIAQQVFEQSQKNGDGLPSGLHSFVTYELDRARRVAFTKVVREIYPGNLESSRAGKK